MSRREMRGRSLLSDMRFVSVAVLLLAATHEAEGFYSAAGRLGGRASRSATAPSRSSQVSTVWSSRPTSTRGSCAQDRLVSGGGKNGLARLAATTGKEALGTEAPLENATVVETAAPAVPEATQEAGSSPSSSTSSLPPPPAAAAVEVAKEETGADLIVEPELTTSSPLPPPPAATAPSKEAVAVDGGDEAKESPPIASAEKAVVVKEGDQAEEPPSVASAEEGDEIEEAPLAAVVDSRTVLLTKRVGEEAEMATSRAERMASLSSDLSRSFAKKEEVDNIIASEIGQLSQKLQQERDIEIAREADLTKLLKEFGETIVEKKEDIEREQDLLAQMQALREQVEEPTIKAPIEAAMAKKADVTSIEVMLLEDLVECKERLGEELKATASRADTMNGVVAALPSAEDTLRMTAYNWQDVQDLQEVLLSSVESMEASDAQVGSLRTKLLDSVRQKREVLGEVSVAKPVADLVEETAERAVKISPGRAFKASQELTEKELLNAAADSSRTAVAGVAKSFVAGVSSLGNYVKSPEAQDVAASTVDLVGAITGAVSSVGNAFQVAKKEFNENSMSGEEMTSFDKIFQSLRSGVKAVKESQTLKEKLFEAGELVSKKVPEAGSKVGKGAAKALKGAATDDAIKNPVKEALDSAQKFAVAMAALATKVFKDPRLVNFQLPGSKPKKDTKTANLTENSPPPEKVAPEVVVSAVPAAKEAGDASSQSPPGDASSQSPPGDAS